MFVLPFKSLQKIEQLGNTIPLEGLVLVLTGHDAQDGLLVYLDDCLPQASHLPWQAITLSSLQEDDLLEYDGLAVGFDVLDLFFPLLPTHGLFFYAIRRLFASLGQLEIYQDNAWRLAMAMYKRAGRLRPRTEEKLIGLLMPTWLQKGVPSWGVALALERDQLSAYIEGQETPRWLSPGDLRAPGRTGNWLLTFAEVDQIFPALKGLHLTEWRPLLYNSENTVLLEQALTELARDIWQDAERGGDRALYIQAYALALERWLPYKADEHLVAVLTPDDFESLLETGDALFVSRAPIIYTGDDHRLALDELLGLSPSEVDWAQYRGPWFALRPLTNRLAPLAPLTLASLERIWYQAGGTVSLANSMQGLANDLVKGSLFGLRTLQLSIQQAAVLALNGTLLFGLSDPWDDAWRGRYGIALDQSYQILDDVLLVAEQELESKGVQILRRWFGFYQEQLVPHNWSALQDTVRDVSAINRDIEITIFDHQLSSTASNAVLAARVLSGERRARAPFDSPKKTGDFMDSLISGDDTPFVADSFWTVLMHWSENHNRLWQIEHSLTVTPPSAEKVDSLLRDYRCLLRSLYALPHEITLLRHFLSQDLRHLNRLQSALHQDVSLRVEMLTPQVVLGNPTRLSFAVANIGGHKATDVRIRLKTMQTMQVNDNPVRNLPELPGRGKPQRLDWHVLPQSMPLLVRLDCSFFDGSQNRQEVFEFDLPAIHKPGKGRGPRGGNPFQAGVAVFGEGFFGRRKELKSIFDLLLSNVTQPILLRGPRRMGKTSTLRQIEYLLKHEGELQRQLGYTRVEEVALRRWQPIAISMQPVHTREDIPGWYFNFLTKIIRGAGITIHREMRRDDFERDTYFVFERYLADLLREHPSLYILILLDEWDVQRHLEEFGGKLRTLMQSSEMERVNWVFASTWMLSDEASRFGSPFYAQTKPFELKEMAWDEAQTLLRTLSEQVGVSWQGEAQVTLSDQTALRPYLIQALGQRIIEHLRVSNPPFNLVTKETVDIVLSQFVQTSRGQGAPFAFLWEDRPFTDKTERASLSWLGRMILLAMDQEYPHPLKSIEISLHLRAKFAARGWSFPDPDCFNDDLRESLSQLVYIFDALEIEGDRYAFSVPLAQEWFHYASSQYDDPWQFAYDNLIKEYQRQSRYAKRKSA